MKLIKNAKRGAARVLSENGGFAASFDKHELRKVKVHFEADDRFFRYVAELDAEEARSLRDNLDRWLAQSRAACSEAAQPRAVKLPQLLQ